MNEPNYRQPNGAPTEYGGRAGDNRSTPSGRRLPGSTGQQAADMRREAFRTANQSQAPARRN